MININDPYHCDILGILARPIPTSSVPISPVAGYHAWFDAQTLVTVDGSNNVIAWDDLGTNNLDLVPGANAVPYDATGLVGKPCITFADTTVRHLTSPAFTSYTGTTFTAFFAVQFTTMAFPRRGFSMAANLATADHTSVTAGIALFTNSGTQIGGYRNGTKSVATGSTGNRYIITSIYDGTSHTTRLNGVAATPVASTGSFNFARYRFGNSTNDGGDAVAGNQFVGKIGEIIVYQGTLTAQQITDNETYMTNRW
jgi:hypothetical protein